MNSYFAYNFLNLKNFFIERKIIIAPLTLSVISITINNVCYHRAQCETRQAGLKLRYYFIVIKELSDDVNSVYHVSSTYNNGLNFLILAACIPA